MKRLLKGIVIVSVIFVFIYWCITREDYRQTMQRNCKWVLANIEEMERFIEEGKLGRNQPLHVRAVWGAMIEVSYRSLSGSIQVPEVFDIIHQAQWQKAMDCLDEALKHADAGEKEEALESLAAARELIETFQSALGEVSLH